jgi:hypothetical protein
VLKCKPTAGSVALLGDGRILYFNALEGPENVEYSALLEIDSSIVNDQIRVLQLNNSTANWISTSPVDAGANPDENDSELLLPGIFGSIGLLPLIDIDTADERTNNDGALFCADLVGLPDGEIMPVGGTDSYAESGVNTKITG